MTFVVVRGISFVKSAEREPSTISKGVFDVSFLRFPSREALQRSAQSTSTIRSKCSLLSLFIGEPESLFRYLAVVA